MSRADSARAHTHSACHTTAGLPALDLTSHQDIATNLFYSINPAQRHRSGRAPSKSKHAHEPLTNHTTRFQHASILRSRLHRPQANIPKSSAHEQQLLTLLVLLGPSTLAMAGISGHQAAKAVNLPVTDACPQHLRRTSPAGAAHTILLCIPNMTDTLAACVGYTCCSSHPQPARPCSTRPCKTKAGDTARGCACHAWC